MSENKKTLLSREYTRRQFLKLTGKGFAGVALSSSMLSLLGCTQAQAEAGLVNVIATPDYVLVANAAKCTGCQRCEINCTLANDGDCHPYMARIHARENLNFDKASTGTNGVSEDPRHGGGMFGLWSCAPETCKQCKDPACMNACPMKAIYVEEGTGIRKIDESKCVGCGLCANACPWHMPRIDVDTKKSTKCVSCGACVAGCPTSALRMVTWEEIAAAL